MVAKHLFSTVCPDLLDPPDPSRGKARKRSPRTRRNTSHRDWHATDPIAIHIFTFGLHPDHHNAFQIHGHKGYQSDRLKRAPYRTLVNMMRGLVYAHMKSVHDMEVDDTAIDDVKFSLVKLQMLLAEAIRRARPRGADVEIPCTTHYRMDDPITEHTYLNQLAGAGDLETPRHERTSQTHQ